MEPRDRNRLQELVSAANADGGTTASTRGLFERPQNPKPLPNQTRCRICGDLGTVLLGDAKRAPRTMPEIMSHEAPCTCPSGDLWRQLFEEFSQTEGRI